MERLNPPELLPPPGGRFAHAVIPPAGSRLAFLAGQVALNLNGEVIGRGDPVRQAGQCFTNVRLVTEALGAGPQDIVQITIYVVGYHPSMLAAMDTAGDEAFDGDWPVAATTLVGVERLGMPDFLVEVTAVVALADDR